MLDTNLLKKRKNLSEKQKKNISKLEKYSEKIENLNKKLENAAKNPETKLSTEKITEKLESLIGEKELLEENLRSSFFPGSYLKKPPKKGEYDYSSSEDEYYNRAKVIPIKDYSENIQNELDRLVTEREEIANKITNLSIGIQENTDDPLDAYMLENNSDLREENLEKLGNRLKVVLGLIAEIEKKFPNIKGNVRSFKVTEIKLGIKKRKVNENSEEQTDRTLKCEKFDRDYEWTPLSGQTGDGRTELNDKYGS